MTMWPNQSVESNRRLAFPFDANRRFRRADHAPPFLSAAAADSVSGTGRWPRSVDELHNERRRGLASSLTALAPVDFPAA